MSIRIPNNREATPVNASNHSPEITFRSRTASSLSGGVYTALGLRGNSGLPGEWPIKTQALFALLTQAKARWG